MFTLRDLMLNGCTDVCVCERERARDTERERYRERGTERERYREREILILAHTPIFPLAGNMPLGWR